MQLPLFAHEGRTDLMRCQVKRERHFWERPGLMAAHTGALDPPPLTYQQGCWSERKCKDINFPGIT